MAHVYDQANAVHFAHRLFAKTGQAGVLVFVTSGRQQGLVVIGQVA